MKMSIVSFTQNGCDLGEKLKSFAQSEQWEVKTYIKSNYAVRENVIRIEQSLGQWTGENWAMDGIVFIGATGIAVRAIAPFVKDKKTDPAVICLDERGTFCIPLLSGHLGGANKLALQISRAIKAVAVITTATDLNDCFAVDLFAGSRNLTISDMKQAKEMSAALLAGKKIVTAGMGCRKGTPIECLEEALETACRENQIPFRCLKQIASIDLKKEEPGLIELSGKYGLPFKTYSAEQLQQAAGEYTTSLFVESITGVDNVCERSAVFASGNGILIQRKMAMDRVTVALAIGNEREEYE